MRASLRPAIWTELRALHADGQEITAPAIRARLEAPPVGVLGRIRDYLAALAAAGYLAPLDDADATPGAWRLVRDPGHEAPRVSPDGSAVTTGLRRERMWHLMRVLKRWTALDLAVHASVDDHPVAESDARDYCQRLCRAGYLRRVAPQTWTLIPARWKGPQPPRVRRDKSIFDPNTGAAYTAAGEVIP